MAAASPPAASGAVNVLLVEDHLAIRKGLALLLRREGIEVVGATADGEEAVRLAERRLPRVVVLDLGLPGLGGVALARRLAALRPAPAILAYTGGGAELDALLAAGDAPAAGVALKAGQPHELVEAVRQLAAGKTYVDPRLRTAQPTQTGDSAKLLSGREREMLTLLASGLSGADIAAKLHLSPETVRTHVRNAMTRLGAQTRGQALVMAIQSGEIMTDAAGESVKC
jgi:DNA-binding NarL/FixJ family response regulator